jgi:site-specific recombinase XerD
MKKPQRVAPGIRIREHDTRKHGIRFDRYFSVYFKVNGKMVEQYLGWASEGWTLEKAQVTINELKQNYKTAAGPVTLKEKRVIEDARKATEDQERIRTEKENVTFKTYFENFYLPVQKTHKGKATWIKETGHAENWIFPVVGSIPLKDISAFHIERIKKNLLDAKKSPRTVQYCLATFRQTWNHARRAGIVTGDSPTRNVKIPKFDNKRQRYLTPAECDLLLEELKQRSDTVYRLALLSLDTGMRFSEIAGLQWQNVDLVRETLALMDTKSGKNRTVYLTDRVKFMLAGMPKSGPDVLVFPGQNGKMTEIGDAFRNAVDFLGLNKGIDDDRLKCVFHSLRHTHASRLLESGADIYRVKELLGHANVTTTERYSHVTADRLRSAVKDMEKMNNRSNIIPLAGRAG